MAPYHFPFATPPLASNPSRLSCVAILARLPRTRDQWNYPFVDTALLDLAQDGYLDLQLVDPFRCEAHSAAHELSHLATLLEQHLQYALSTFVRLHPTESQRGDTISRHETLHSDFSFPAGKRRMKNLLELRHEANMAAVMVTMVLVSFHTKLCGVWPHYGGY